LEGVQGDIPAILPVFARHLADVRSGRNLLHSSKQNYTTLRDIPMAIITITRVKPNNTARFRGTLAIS